MDQLPSRKPGSDAARRNPEFSIFGLWLVPVAFLSLWLLAGGFTLAALASATAAWRAMPVLAAPEAAPVLPAPVSVTPAAGHASAMARLRGRRGRRELHPQGEGAGREDRAGEDGGRRIRVDERDHRSHRGDDRALAAEIVREEVRAASNGSQVRSYRSL